MRILNRAGRLTLVTDVGVVDVAEASAGRFGPDVQEIYARWGEFRAWVQSCPPGSLPVTPMPSHAEVGPPVPRPAQVFAIGLNYKSHALESGLELPVRPMVFTKFPASIAGPYDAISLPTAAVDWEVELVAVIAEGGRNVSEEKAWSHVAGLTIGQDISERDLQVTPPAPQQFSLAKSFVGFAPIGPQLVTPDEFENPDDIQISCTLGTEQMQVGRTGDLIFSVPRLVSYLSSVLPLLPGDLIFTGTPSGIGWARKPQRFLTAADELITTVEGIGQMRNTFLAGPERAWENAVPTAVSV